MRRLPIEDIHLRHWVISPKAVEGYLEATSVCLAQHHQSPAEFEIQDDGELEMVEVHWQAPDDRSQGTWGDNKTNTAIENGACVCAIAAVELRRALFACQHARSGSGIDYILLPSKIYVTPSGAEDLEEAWGLEVSGTVCGKSVVKKRLQTKLKQSQAGRHSLPSIACVVGFNAKLILMQSLKA